MSTAYLVLDDGMVFRGTSWGATGTTIADVSVSTQMTGYQGVLSSPDSTGTIVLMTAPHIGNVGVNDETPSVLTAAGVVVREPARRPSSWKSTGALETSLQDSKVIGISNVDTRAVAIHLRESGRPMRGAIISGEALAAFSPSSQEFVGIELFDNVMNILGNSQEAY